eukprot:SAG22_NODE_6200_length_887_cov_0.874365_1_plen_39_part_10
MHPAGRSWAPARPVFPHLHATLSLAGSLATAPDGAYLVL